MPTTRPPSGDIADGPPGPPPLIRPHDTALFLDLDGTLLEIADTPDHVRAAEGLVQLLREVALALDGAVAILSGRRLERVDELLKPLVLPGAGVYGAQMRLQPGGDIKEHPIPDQSALVEQLSQRFSADRRILVENKGAAVAVHFRLAPEREGDVRHVVAALAPCPPLKILEGKRVVEACPAGQDKGWALDQLMAVEPFKERAPVFVGDDHADEPAFAAAGRHAGYGVKVGDGDSNARYRLGSSSDVRRWLHSLVEPNRRVPR